MQSAILNMNIIIKHFLTFFVRKFSDFFPFVHFFFLTFFFFFFLSFILLFYFEIFPYIHIDHMVHSTDFLSVSLGFLIIVTSILYPIFLRGLFFLTPLSLFFLIIRFLKCYIYTRIFFLDKPFFNFCGFIFSHDFQQCDYIRFAIDYLSQFDCNVSVSSLYALFASNNVSNMSSWKDLLDSEFLNCVALENSSCSVFSSLCEHPYIIIGIIGLLGISVIGFLSYKYKFSSVPLTSENISSSPSSQPVQSNAEQVINYPAPPVEVKHPSLLDFAAELKDGTAIFTCVYSNPGDKEKAILVEKRCSFINFEEWLGSQ